MTHKQLARFISKITFVELDEDFGECWIWNGFISSNGYGHFKVGRRSSWAHRVSHAHFVCEIPDGTEIDHLCRARACVNPRHLEAVSHKLNVRRGLAPIFAKIRMTGNTINLGIPRTSITKAKLSAARMGIKLSDETRAKMSKSKMGHPGHNHTAEARARIGAANAVHQLGRTHTPETKAKMAAARSAYWQRKREAA